MTTRNLLLGVDGGGSRTRAWIAEVEPSESNFIAETIQPLGCGEAGASNPLSVGVETAKAEVLTAITAARENAELESAVPFDGACIGLAGVGTASIRDAMLSWALGAVNRPCSVTTDADLVLHAADDRGVGIALIGGTGSLAMGKSSAGAWHRCGGWGRLLGDEGGGYRIALDAFRAICRANDGRDEATTLTGFALQFFDVTAVRSLHAQVLAAEPSQIAEFAPTVIELANEDAAARRIVEHHASELATLALRVADQLDDSESQKIALAGGLLVKNQRYRGLVEHRLLERMPHAVLVPVADPVRGALQIASST